MEIKGFSTPLKSCENTGSPDGPFQAGFPLKVGVRFSQKKRESRHAVA
jgi:hypothetical protein